MWYIRCSVVCILSSHSWDRFCDWDSETTVEAVRSTISSRPSTKISVYASLHHCITRMHSPAVAEPGGYVLIHFLSVHIPCSEPDVQPEIGCVLLFATNHGSLPNGRFFHSRHDEIVVDCFPNLNHESESRHQQLGSRDGHSRYRPPFSATGMDTRPSGAVS